MNDIKLNTIEEAIEEFRKGNFLIVVDDADRENEGDLVIAAQCVTPEKVNFMETCARGELCVPLTAARCAELDLPMQVQNNTSLHATPFTVTVDLLVDGCTTGISASDRCKTIRALVDRNTLPEHLGRPGHIHPLRAHDKGVLSRIGHTEAAIDMAKLAGMEPAAALIEIKRPDGEMARLPQLMDFARQYEMKIIAIADLVKYRLERETLIERGAEVHLPTEYGDFHLIPFRQIASGLEHVALIKGEWEKDEPILVRVHSSCITGDIFASKRCECGEQLHRSMQMIADAGKGVIIYLNQEGRGIGLMAKIEAYRLQEEGMDTVDANLHLGYNADEREYGVGAAILRQLGVNKMRLLTNNPVKRRGLESFGLEITENVSIEITPNPYNERYLKTKKERMGHYLRKI